jgi:hypothetical protein
LNMHKPTQRDVRNFERGQKFSFSSYQFDYPLHGRSN